MSLSIFILIMVVLLFLQVPSVKQYLADQALLKISELTDHRAELGEVRMSWLDFASGKDFRLYDFNDSLMVAAEEISINFDLLHAFDQESIYLDDILFEGIEVYLTKYNDSTSMNLVTFLNQIKSKQYSDPDKPSLPIYIGNIEFEEVILNYNDMRVAPKNNGKLDFSHVAFKVEEGYFHDLSVESDSIHFRVLSLKGQEKYSGLRIKDWTSDIHIDSQHIVLSDLALITPHSDIRDSVALSFNSFGNLAQFTDSVQMDINLVDTDIGMEDLRLLANLGQQIDSVVHVTTRMQGTLSNLFVPTLDVSLSSGTGLVGNAQFIGLPDLENTFIDLNVSSGLLKSGDIKQMIGKYSFRDDIRIQGNFLGFIKDFVASANFDTPHGNVVTDINIKIPTRLQEAEYSGQLTLQSFDLGRAVQNDRVSTLDLQGKVEGSGITKETAKFFVDAKAQHLVLNDYSYDSLEVKGNFASRFFKGDFFVKDPHCQIKGLAILDYTSNTERLFAQAKVDTLNLYDLNFSKDKLNFHTSVSVNVKNLNLDEVTGSVEFRNATIENQFGSKTLHSLKLDASALGDERKYVLESSELKGDFSGKFVPTVLLEDLPRVIESYYELLTNDRSGEFYLAEDQSFDSLRSYEWDIRLDVVEINSILKLFNLPVKLSDNSFLEASFRKSKNVNLSMYAEMDTISIMGNELYNNVLDVNASRGIASPDVLAIIQLSSTAQNWTFTNPTTNLSLESTWFNNDIESQVRLTEPKLNDKVVLNSEVTYFPDSIMMRVKPSNINVLGNKWKVNPENRIRWEKEQLHLVKLGFSSGEQSFQLGGETSRISATYMDFKFKNFELENLDAFLPKHLSGRLNAEGIITRTLRDSLVKVASQVSIAEMAVDDLQMGDLEGFTRWDARQEAVYMDFKILTQGINTVELSGRYKPNAKTQQLDLELDFDKAALNMSQPFVESLFSDMDGVISGKLNIGGRPANPTFYGSGTIEGGKALFNYTKTEYTFDGRIDFDSYEIALRGLNITDGLNGRGKLFGSIYHDQLQDMQMDFNATFNKLQMLNTTAVDSDVYYGRAYGTGSLKLSGPISQLSLNAEIKSEPGTRIFFPLESSASVHQEDFITFVDPNEEPDPDVITKRQSRSSGMSIQMDLNVTPDAYAEMIFDAQSGDILRGRAQGNLQFKMDPNGEFSLLGGLEIAQGAYNFTVPGINKEFELEKGGTISWVGDPYQGIIDLQASYRQLATLSQWDPSITNTTKIPFLVVLGLKGSMLKPEISFQIETADDVTVLPGEDGQGLRRFLITTNDREDELNRQVFSLLMLRKLSPQNSFVVGGVGRGISGSVSELLANQLSYWLSQSNENLEVDIDLAGLDQDAFNTFQYRLAYTFLDGRLRVSGGSSLNNQVTGAATSFANDNNLIGNWAVEYLLSPDGRWRAKFFSKSAQNLTANSENNQQTGISFQYIRSFDQFQQLIKKSRDDEEAAIQIPPAADRTSAKAN
ncbi:MAG: translocation/assembly module TamB domain-containing protein [Cytophagales bacterium]|nr:translocation/assembly module TamB domain-containing protein [Cytophagales bacterium]